MILWPSKDNFAGHNERKKKKRQTEDVGKQYFGVDRDETASSTRAGEDRTRRKVAVVKSTQKSPKYTASLWNRLD